MARNDFATVLFGVVLLFSLALITTLVIGNPILQSDRLTEDKNQTDHALLNGTQWVDIRENRTGTNETVYDSRGYAVNLTGADTSWVRADADYTIATDDHWTVSTWARADRDASADAMAAISVDGRLIVSLNRTSDEWRVWYYDESGRNSYELAIPAPNQPANFTNIQVVSNATHLRVYRNNSLGAIANVTTQSITDAPVNASNWNGRLEEIRTLDEGLNTSQRQALVDSPVQHQADWQTTSRAMFDEPDAETQLLLYTDTRLETQGVSFSDGLDGTELAAGSDYRWNESGPAIQPIAGGALDGAPVAYVEFQLADPQPVGMAADIQWGWNTAMALAGIIPLLAVGGVIVLYLMAAGPRR